MAERTATRSAANAAEGSALDELTKAHNKLATAFNALLAKMDADTGITDTNYVALHGDQDTLTLRP
jgi:hypothetical protein